MSLTREQILEYAQRYVPDASGMDFPYNGDLFCFFERSVSFQQIKPSGKSGWKFGGYAVCIKYTLDEDSKPEGKWLWLHFVGLATFPPVRQTLKLQPPHVVVGEFQSADRSIDIRIVKMPVDDVPSLLRKDNFSIYRKGMEEIGSGVEEKSNDTTASGQNSETESASNSSVPLNKDYPARAGKILQFPSRNNVPSESK